MEQELQRGPLLIGHKLASRFGRRRVGPFDDQRIARLSDVGQKCYHAVANIRRILGLRNSTITNTANVGTITSVASGAESRKVEFGVKFSF